MANGPIRFASTPGRKKDDQPEDLGFGTKVGGEGIRLINRNGSFNIERQGKRGWTPYQSLVEMSWGQFLCLVLLFYVGINLFFGLLFWILGVENLSGLEPGKWWENFLNCVFFSIQTFTTVGYGSISPVGIWANVLASLDALVGLISLALATGLFFAKFSKPRAQIIFSEKALIAPYKDGWSFQFRIANRRDNKIIDLDAKVTVAWLETTENGQRRRFAGLNLERDQVFMFPLNWTIVHPIDASSPLFGWDEGTMRHLDVEFIILIEGHDETFAQTVHTVSSYTWREIVWAGKFDPMYFPGLNGKTILALDKISDYSELEGVIEEEE